MDTKLKKDKIKPVRSIIALLLATVLTVFYIVCGVLAVVAVLVPEQLGFENSEHFNSTISAIWNNDLAQTPTYVHTLYRYLYCIENMLHENVLDSGSLNAGNTGYANDYYNLSSYFDLMQNDLYYGNVSYYAENNGKIIKSQPNETKTSAFASDPDAIGIVYRNGVLYSLLNGSLIPVKDAGYVWNSTNYYDAAENMLKNAFPDADISIYASSSPIKNLSDSSPLYNAARGLYIARAFIPFFIIGFALTVLLLVYTVKNRRSLSYVVRKIGALLSHVLLEIKLAYFALLFWYSTAISFYSALYYITLGVIALSLIFTVIDLVQNRAQFFLNNIIRNIFVLIERLNSLPAYEKSERRHFISFIAFEIGAAVIAALAFTAYIIQRGDPLSVFILIVSLIAAVYGIVRHSRHMAARDRDITMLLERIECMKTNGIDASGETLSADSKFRDAYDTLGNIYEHVRQATEKSLRSERMKLELVTNVSHDLKTPLTSIVSYVDLLSHEEGLSDTARDYISVLENKSARLKALISDLFDLSKAASNNISVHNEPIDLVRLCNQVNAELDDKISESGLSFMVRCPENPVLIYSDGAMLHRVIENLVINAVKYSLAGSRVYIDVANDGVCAAYTIRNTSAEVIQCSADELLARFVRGDNSRTSEGSGLGLSIAQSYTELCGGNMELTLDGDLFKVKLSFPLYTGQSLTSTLSGVSSAEEIITQEQNGA